MVGDEEVVHMVKTWIDHWEDRIQSSELMSEGSTGNIICMYNRRLVRKQEKTSGRGGNSQNVDLDLDNTIDLEVFAELTVQDAKNLTPPIDLPPQCPLQNIHLVKTMARTKV